MKNKNKILVLALSAVLLTTYASAYAIDGNLNDWGVTPFSDWVPDTGTVDYTVEDFTGSNWESNGHPWGGEHYDLEAMYFDDDSHNAYFAIVTSMGPQGYGGCSPGDMALDLDQNGVYEYGIVLTNLGGFTIGTICHNPTWSTTWSNPSNPLRVTSCTATGTATVVYTNAHIGPDNGAGNWVIEIRAPKTAIGQPQQGSMSNLHATISCGNDIIELEEYSWDFSVPEFVSGSVAFLIVLLTPGFAYLMSKK